MLITAIGVSMFLQNLSQLIFGSEGKMFPTVVNIDPITVGDKQISFITIITIIVTVLLMIGLQILVKNARIRQCAPSLKILRRASSWV